LVYVIALLAVVHFFMQSKLETYQPVLMSGFLIWLLAYRALWRRNGVVTPVHLLLLAFAVALVTAAGEALLYMLTSGVNGWRVLLAHLDLDIEVRPAWWVLVAGLMAAGLGFRRRQPAHQRASARRTSSDALSGATQVQSGS
jgi:sulfoxide reductase heme-binding subunit YedZ